MVLDSCFTDFGDVLDRNFADVTGYPTFLLPGGLLMTRLLLHVDMAGVKPINDLPRTRTPLLMIYGDHDRYVTLAQEHAMAAARPDADFWLVAGPAHSAIYDRYPTEYIAHVTQFLAKAMP
jgi:pimeloyl-ACP methyl ester carboxylesterase